MSDTEFIDIASGMYVGEPCRICGLLLTVIDVKDGAVFAGYSADNKSRAAHKLCWDNAADIHRAAIAAKDAEIAELKEKLRPTGYHDVEEFYRDEED